MMVAIILLISWGLSYVSVSLFYRYVYPKLSPHMTLSQCRPFTCEKCMVFWWSIILLGFYNLANGFDYKMAIIYLLLSLLNFKIYENVIRKLLQ